MPAGQYRDAARANDPPQHEVKGSNGVLTTKQVAAFAQGGQERPRLRTVSYWAMKGYVSPTIAKPRGRRHEVLWTPNDAVCVRVFASLRQVRCSLDAAAEWVEQRVRFALARPTAGMLLVAVANGQLRELQSGDVRDLHGYTAGDLIILALDTWRADAVAFALDRQLELW